MPYVTLYSINVKYFFLIKDFHYPYRKDQKWKPLDLKA